MNRSVWIDRGQSPDGSLKARGFEVAYVDIRDATNATLAEIRACGLEPGVYACSQGDGWPSATSISGFAWANWVSGELKRFTPNTATNPRVHLNCETHSLTWIRDMLARYRQLRPTRITGWTPEAHQATLFQGIAPAIVAAQVDVLPQCYVTLPTNPMARVESANEVLAWARIVPIERICPMLDASQMGEWALENGACAFTQGRLPQ